MEHKLILGTHVDPESSDRNYLMIATVRLPTADAELKVGAYDEERGELGGYGGSLAKFDISVRINHPTEVHRARYCPNNPFLIATKTAGPDVLVFDYSRHPNRPADDRVTPLLRLAGHSAEGYGIAWSGVTKGHLLSGSDDGRVCGWDVSSGTGSASAKSATDKPEAGGAGGASGGGGGGGTTPLAPLFSFSAHSGAVVEDVAWHGSHGSIFGSASDDGSVHLWDSRALGSGLTPTAKIANAHKGNAMCLAFNPTREFLLASGGTDKVVQLWDARHLAKPMHTLAWHEDDVLGVSWCPFSDSHIASSSADRRVIMWDTSRIGREQDPEDAEDGPPEIQFIHGGHTDRIADFSWNEKDQWFFASVADDNVLQVWQPSEEVLEDDYEFDDGIDGAAPASKKAKQVVADDELE